MKISKSKQELARIISENGGWISLANMAVYGKISGECYLLCADEPPVYDVSIKGFYINARDVVASFKSVPFNNWHLTVLYRNEYFHLYPAPDAGGWIEWSGGEKPHIDDYEIVDTRHRAGHIECGNRACDLWWDHRDTGNDIIAYRPHRPGLADSAPETKPTIEQLAADYRKAKDYAERKQQEADDAKADADEKLRVLELAGEANGLIVSPTAAKQEPELVITDWRDLQAGDVISVSGKWWEPDSEYTVDENDGSRDAPIRVGDYWAFIGECSFKFIRRP